eukprot:123771-Heterocapsa_arctica.AAC.1
MVGAGVNMPSGLSLKITKSAVSSKAVLSVGSWKCVLMAPKTRHSCPCLGAQSLKGIGMSRDW